MLSRFCLFFFGFASLYANPQKGSVAAGSAAMHESGSLLEIEASNRAVLDWESFSIQAHETTRFHLPSVDAAVLNRVMGGEISQLMGQLQANGRVYLVNPNGIIVGRDAIINTAGLLATTLQIPMEEFVEGKELYLFGDHSGTIENLGTIVSASGPIYLFAHRVENRGTIEAPLVSIGAGSEFLVKPEGEVELFIRAEGRGFVENEGKIRGLTIQIQSDGFQSLAINHKGIIQAERISEEGGKIFLRAPEGGIEIANGSEVKGETVAIEGNNVYHMGAIDASEIAIEGNSMYCDGTLQAKILSIDTEKEFLATRSSTLMADDIAIAAGKSLFSSATCNAKEGTIHLSADRISLYSAELEAAHITAEGKQVKINATSRLIAEGGTILLLAEGKMNQQGKIQAKGGFVEVSGKEVICRPERITAKELLLDPFDIVIDDTLGGYPQYELIDPDAGGSSFGFQVLPLSTGNVAVANPFAGGSNEGAVYLFDGFTGAFINSVFGTNTNDFVGQGDSTTSLFAVGSSGSNYVISSPDWATSTGAATFVNGISGLSGPVSAANSLVGLNPTDEVSSGGITVLTNGHYVVSSPEWNGTFGAATWGNGSTGTTGTVSGANSLIGSAALDAVSSGGITALTNDNYVVASPGWDGVGATFRGAATWCDGSGPTADVVDATNSLIGILGSNDRVSSGGIFALTNDNYVVSSPEWQGTTSTTPDAGAATLGDGTSGTTGIVGTTTFSVIGGFTNAAISSGGVTALTNDNFVISSPNWNGDAGAGTDLGAVTWRSGSTVLGSNEIVDSLNSIVGLTNNYTISSGGITALAGGYYVISSPEVSDLGAATPVDGSSQVTGFIEFTPGSVPSLFGTNAGDRVSSGGVTALPNGNYVVSSPEWQGDGGLDPDLGAVTWQNITTALMGDVIVMSTNSIIGATSGDAIGSSGSFALTNGNFVIASPDFDGTIGAATWVDPDVSTVDVVSMANSIYGSAAGDQVGFDGILALSTGDYVVLSSAWNGGEGAATFADGTTSTTAEVSQDNSVVGGTATMGMGTVVEDSVNGTFIVPFPTDGIVRVGLESINQLTAGIAADQTIFLSPAAIEDAINAGTSVTLAATNSITFQGGTPLGLFGPAGTSFNLNAGGNLTISTSVLAGDTSLNFTAGGDLTIENSAIVETSGIGNILLIAGVNLNGSGPVTVHTTGTGTLTLVADNQFPSSPNVGPGIINFSSDATLATAGGNLRIYTSGPNGNFYPTTINGATPPGTEVFGIYYPDGTGGVPFQIFYKGTVFNIFAQTILAYSAALAQTFPTDSMLSQMEGDESGTVNSADGLSTDNISPCQGG